MIKNKKGAGSMNQNEAIIWALTDLGGEGTIQEVRD